MSYKIEDLRNTLIDMIKTLNNKDAVVDLDRAKVAASLCGSNGSTAVPFAAVRTAQNRQPRVQVSPSTINVAVPALQHSAMFGQCASWHTV
jgi:hypothetical protein